MLTMNAVSVQMARSARCCVGVEVKDEAVSRPAVGDSMDLRQGGDESMGSRPINSA